MPIYDEPLFDHPSSRATLWRYMDISKFVDLLATRTLYFARADRFADIWEGAISPLDVRAAKKMFAGEEDQKQLSDNYDRTFAALRKHTYISCWHRNDGESAAMWKLYLKSDEGIAVQTSFYRLSHELGESSRLIRIGKVRYKNYMKEPVPGGTPHPIGDAYIISEFAPFIHKRVGFIHEKEVRAVFQDKYKRLDDPSEHTHGLRIKLAVENLIECVYVAPGTPGWLREAVQSILKCFGIDKDVRRSEFDEPPPC